MLSLAYWPSLPTHERMGSAEITAFVLSYRCGAAPDFHRRSLIQKHKMPLANQTPAI